MFFEGRSIGSRVIQWISKSRFSHVGLIVMWGDRFMLLQAEPGAGVQAVPLSIEIAKYNGVVEWYKLRDEARQKVDMHKVVDGARIDLGLEYNWQIGLRWMIRVALDWRWGKIVHRPQALFCSQYVERCYALAGFPLTEGAAPEWTDPGEVSKSKHLENRGPISHHRDIRAER